MKFLILKTKDRNPGQPQFRVFLSDGTELTSARRISISGNPAQRTVTLHSINQPYPDKLHFEVDSVELEFVDAEVEMIEEPPPSLTDRLRALAANWTQNHGGYSSDPADMAIETAQEECAAELLALLDELKPC